MATAAAAMSEQPRKRPIHHPVPPGTVLYDKFVVVNLAGQGTYSYVRAPRRGPACGHRQSKQGRGLAAAPPQPRACECLGRRRIRGARARRRGFGAQVYLVYRKEHGDASTPYTPLVSAAGSRKAPSLPSQGRLAR